jgi:hypothetical protein
MLKKYGLILHQNLILSHAGGRIEDIISNVPKGVAAASVKPLGLLF